MQQSQQSGGRIDSKNDSPTRFQAGLIDDSVTAPLDTAGSASTTLLASCSLTTERTKIVLVGLLRVESIKPCNLADCQYASLLLESSGLRLANDVNAYGEGVKRLHHAELGLLELEFSAFAVDGRPDLGMIVYNPATSADEDRIRAHIKSRVVLRKGLLET